MLTQSNSAIIFSFAVWDADKWEGASVSICIYSDSRMVEVLDKM